MDSHTFRCALIFAGLSLVCFAAAENICPDGEQLCAEGCVSIEHKCKRQLCPYPLIECKDRRKCYDKEQECDKVFDCLDRSDELGCGRTTPSPYYYNPNKTQDTGPEEKKSLLSRWPGILLIVVVVLILTVLLTCLCVYWTLKCRLLHDQIAYDEKHKFMEEHGEMPSAGPVISGVRPPQDGWKYVTKSAYMMLEEKAAPTSEEPAKMMNAAHKEVPKAVPVLATETITETDEREEDQASPGTPDPPAYEEAVKFYPEEGEAEKDAEKTDEEEATSSV